MNYIRILALTFSVFTGVNLFSQSNTDSLATLLTTNLDDTTRIDVLGVLSGELFGVESDQAIAYAKEASELAENIGDLDRQGKMLKNVGIGYFYAGDFIDVMAYWQASLEVYQKLEDPEGVANLLSNIGAVYNSTGDYTKALEYFLESLQIAEENNDEFRVGTVLQNIGSVYSNKEEFESSQEYYEKALDICRSLDYKKGIATVGMNLSEVYSHFKSYEKAIAALSESRSIFEELNDPSLPEALNRISLLKLEQNKLDEAEKEVLNSYAISTKNNSKVFLQKADTILGQIYHRTNRSSASITRFKEAIELGGSIGVNRDQQDAYEGLIEVYKKLGDYQLASKAQDSLISLVKEIYNLEQEESFSNLQLKFDLEKRESEIIQLSAENALQEIQVSKARTSRNFFIALASLFFIGGFGFFTFLRNQKLKKDVKEKIDIANYERRISQALHKFVPMAFIKTLGRDHILKVELGDQSEQEVTVVFTDIRSYTSLSEQMTPNENFKFIKQYAEKMGPAIVSNGGFINQYMGDGIMAIFQGAPDGALKACIQMQEAVRLFNEERKDLQIEGEIKVGMGLHTGSLVMGIIGDQTRQDAALISDTVNTAQRLETLTKKYGAGIILSGDTLEKMTDHSQFNVRELGKSFVKGKKEAVVIYECIDGDNIELWEIKKQNTSVFNSAVALFTEGNDVQALRAFKDLAQECVNDPVITNFLDQLNQKTLTSNTI